MTSVPRIATALALSIAVAIASVLTVNTLQPGAGLVGTALVPGLLAGLITGLALRPVRMWWPALAIAALTGIVVSTAAVLVRVGGGYDAMALGAVFVAVIFAVFHAGPALLVQRLAGLAAPAA